MDPVVLNPEKYRVNRSGQEEVITQSLYDIQAYAQAGQTSLTFFQIPVGQSSKTLADTNMVSAGQLPAQQRFLVQAIEVAFWPLNTASAQGAIVAANLNDVIAVSKSGWLDFFIGTKSYCREAPIGRFPATFGVGSSEALSDSSTAGAGQVTVADYARFAGIQYRINPVLLESNQNFNVSLNWPTAVSITVAGRIGVFLRGTLYRTSQ